LQSTHEKPAPLPHESLWLAHWVLFAASCNIAGWVLSPLRLLTPAGLLIAIPCIWAFLALLADAPMPRFRRPRFTRHIRRRGFLPLSFFTIALLALASGIIHPPNNYDALNYRMPRLAHWLMAGRWEWIPANFQYLNTRACGFEWITAPFLALLRSDRPVFLINIISFLFLPGLVFGVFHRMGVAAKVARAWMWLLPSGYCFALQAGGIGNDLAAVLFTLAAFDFGLRWRDSRSRMCFALALVSAGMMTAIKPTTITLLLPFAVLFAGMWRHFLKHPPRAAALACACALASFLPTAVINHLKCGDWTGAAIEDAALGMVKPLQGIIVNLINAPIQNLAPPVFPLANQWNAWFPSLFPGSFLDSLEFSFEARAARFGLTDIQGEEAAGVGIGISMLWLGSLIAASARRGRNTSAISSTSPRNRRTWVFALLFGAALLAYFSKTGLNTVARHIAPFYPFLIAIPLAAAPHARIIRSRIWNLAAFAAVASTIVMMIITPSRPLWPANRVITRLSASNPSPMLERAAVGYSVYAQRADALGVLRDALPQGTHTIGLLSFAPGPELPLWKPYLQRKVRHILRDETHAELSRSGVQHIVLCTANFEPHMRLTPGEWVDRNQATIIKRQTIRMLAKEPASEWWLVKLPDNR
jgi:hypothetical protein